MAHSDLPSPEGTESSLMNGQYGYDEVDVIEQRGIEDNRIGARIRDTIAYAGALVAEQLFKFSEGPEGRRRYK